MPITSEEVKAAAAECGFELAGLTPALPHEDFGRFEDWRQAGLAGEMGYLTDHRGDLRADPRHLLPEARSILCVGKLYNTGVPAAAEDDGAAKGVISRYASGTDYHEVVRFGLKRVRERLEELHGAPLAARICVDTAPLLERSYAQAAGLGWIGRNTCLINERKGSWFFLGEMLLSLPLPSDWPAPERCGSCTRCIDSCPTEAIVPDRLGDWRVDARLCISYLTIEKRGALPEPEERALGNLIFGCDICQDVCPWNRRDVRTSDPAFTRTSMPADLRSLAELSSEDFRVLFRQSPVWRAKYEGFLRNVAAAMGNSGNEELAEPLRRLAAHPLPVVAETARRALAALAKR